MAPVSVSSPPAVRAWRAASWALLLLAALRLIALWANDPLLALANNYDMLRVQACIDAYPDRSADIPPASNSYTAPLERYRFLAGVETPCFPTSEALFAAAAWPGMWIEQALGDGTFSLRWVGGVKLLLTLIAILSVDRALRRSCAGPQLALGHAALVAVVLADPGTGLYLNGFYAEYATIFFGYVLMTTLAIAAARAPARPSAALCVGIVTAAALLALSKAQHVVTPLLALAILIGLRGLGLKIDRRLLIALAFGAGIGALLQGAHLASDKARSMHRANVVNTVFYAMLPESMDRVVLTRALGLPETCARHSGSSWFSPGMQEGQLCPEALDLTRADVARGLLAEPLLLPRMAIEGLRRSRPWIPPYLGVVEGEELGRLPATHPSLDRLWQALPPALHLAWFAALPIAAIAAVRLRRDPSQAPANLVLGLCAFLPWLGIVVVVFGDGYADTAKQFHLGHTLALAGGLLALLLAADALVRRVGAGDRKA
jgi:hypothetical protein